MRWYLYLIAILLITPCVSAAINITPSSIGETYIQWEWNEGLTITTILIDGTEICGYETLSNVSLRTGLDPGSLHSINITATTGDVGYNQTLTLNATAASTIVDFSPDALSAAFGLVGGLITSVLVVRRYGKNKGLEGDNSMGKGL